LLHELATNAIKYGALSNEDGHVALTWRIDGADEPRVILEWSEQGGPEVTPPSRKGFGSKLVRLGLVGTGGSTVRYDSSGLIGSFEAGVEEVAQA
jgi:two-component sensor histidine kinase